MIPSKALDWVVFDLGAVLIDWNRRYVYRRFTSDESLIELFLDRIATGEWNSRMDAGELFQSAIDERIRQFPDWKEWLQAWRDYWPTMLNGPILSSVQIFEEVVRQRQCGRLKGVLALSNWEANTFRIAQARFPFLAQFDAKLISGEERMIKPDPLFFKLLIERHQVQPEKCLFIDDVQRNIEAAAALGFLTHHFTSAQALRQHLIELRILEGV
jgi:2-haloacid dehalogenase